MLQAHLSAFPRALAHRHLCLIIRCFTYLFPLGLSLIIRYPVVQGHAFVFFSGTNK